MNHAAKIINLKSSNENLNEVLSLANQVIVDKENTIKLAIACVLANGHLLIEDRPGLGKTSLVKVLSQLLGMNSQRIQFTNDMLPADIIGTSIFNQNTQSFDFHKGPIFANIVLADEINRATPKTQSACLQAMEEYQVHIDGKTFDLPSPFFLIATQNPQDNVGTFALPESQMDRFLMRIQMGLPSRAAERELIMGRDRSSWIKELPQILNANKIKNLINEVQKVHISDGVLDYLQNLVEKSRILSQGLSPRAVIDLTKAAKAWAFICDRDFVIPEDIQSVAKPVMNHRLGESGTSAVSGYELSEEILSSVAVP
jgi:MoxR-like ATPase